MIFCQGCGAENTDGARFCNMCGVRIAKAGEKGGPLPSAGAAQMTRAGHDNPVAAAERAPASSEVADRASASGEEGSAEVADVSSGHADADHASEPEGSVWAIERERLSNLDISTVSLSAIGVRTRSRAWITVLGVTLGLVGLGAGGTYWAMSSSEPAPSPSPPPPAPVEPPEEVYVGDPIPDGSETPEVVVATEQPSGASRSGRRGSRSGNTGRSTRRRSASQTSPRESGGSQPSGGTPSEGAPTPSPAVEDPSSESGSGASPGAPPPSATDTGGDESGGAEASDTEGERSQRDWEAMQEGQGEERDLEMDLYASRVRRFIRSYYIRRAAGCFERESRNDRNVRGTVVVGFVIPASGIVEDARVVRNSTGSETLAACLARQVGSWRLPAPPDGAAPLEMQMPFSR